MGAKESTPSLRVILQLSNSLGPSVVLRLHNDLLQKLCDRGGEREHRDQAGDAAHPQDRDADDAQGATAQRGR